MPKLTRERYIMPGDVKQALAQRGVMDDYLGRPDYQQNGVRGHNTYFYSHSCLE